MDFPSHSRINRRRICVESLLYSPQGDFSRRAPAPHLRAAPAAATGRSGVRLWGTALDLSSHLTELGKNQAEAAVAAAAVGVAVVAIRHPAAPGIVVPTAAAQHAVRPVLRAFGVGLG